MTKPFAPSCERNQAVLLDVLQSIITVDDKHLLEIGSGTEESNGSSHLTSITIFLWEGLSTLGYKSPDEYEKAS